ncbi:twin-arginine translocation signal domain-containing protein [Pseudomonas sp. 2FE]|uniref:twin-arginine translocation signal domain-containing protein n=1 Tax=Pseudomonas sp. 2FE TaxID=2502190 RepID=UPI0010F9A23B
MNRRDLLKWAGALSAASLVKPAGKLWVPDNRRFVRCIYCLSPRVRWPCWPAAC